MAGGDKRLAEAMRQLRDGPQQKEAQSKSAEGKVDNQDQASQKAQSGSKQNATQFTPNGGQLPAEGFYSWLRLADSTGVRNVSKVLQTKIQEAILAGALMDADQPVPPAYKELVEKYYRALSDDLR
jgi:hypothetical protein